MKWVASKVYFELSRLITAPKMSINYCMSRLGEKIYKRIVNLNSQLLDKLSKKLMS